jgi:hypothetical protein
VHEVLGKKLAERNRRCDQRETATAWLLGHTKFKQMTLTRFWKQFKPLALENIEATQLLQRLKQSAANGDHGGHGNSRRGNGNTADTEFSDDDNDENEDGIHVVPSIDSNRPTAYPAGVHVVDKTPWLNEHPKSRKSKSDAVSKCSCTYRWNTLY